MKTKNALLALAALGMYAGAASAQSSVTLSGLVDLSANHLQTGDVSKYALSRDQLSYSRLTFRGIEDLGSGLKASFWLEAGLDASQGSVGGPNGFAGSQGTAGGTAFFNRRSTVSLSNRFGEVRIGRDFDPTLWNMVDFDVYGAAGLGDSLNLASPLNSGAQTIAYANNSVSYLTPDNLGGLYGQATVAAGEGTPGQKYTGGRFGYKAGGFNAAVAYSATKTAFADDYKVANGGVSYDFGFVKVFGLVNESKFQSAKLLTTELSASVPAGGYGQINVAYAHANASGVDAVTGLSTNANDATQLSAQYLYNLSKRTALYTGVGRIKNKGVASFSVDGADSPPPTAGGQTSTGYNVGIRHSF